MFIRVLYAENNPNRSKFMHEKMKSGLKSGNARYQSVQNLLSYDLVSRNRRIKL